MLFRALLTALAVVPSLQSNLSSWVRNENLNCYKNHGAVDLESPQGSSCGLMSIKECQTRCENFNGCTAITVLADASGQFQCYRRSNLNVADCDTGGAYTTYATGEWQQAVGLNCYSGKGGIDLESPTGSDCGTMTLADCQAKCQALEGCNGITVKPASAAGMVQCFRRGATDFSTCSHDAVYESYKFCCGKEPSDTYTNNYQSENPLNIQPDVSKRSNNYFLIIGDWGKSGGPSKDDCMDGVANMMNRYIAKQTSSGKTLLFVAAVGDNFYWQGVEPSKSWQLQWAQPYGTQTPGAPLYKVPWLAVHGNHDLGDADPYALCPDVKPKATINGQHYAGEQLNADRNPTRPNGTAHYWLPDFNYHYHIPQVGLELIAVDRNLYDIDNLGGNPQGHAKAFAGCGGKARVASWLTKVTDAGDRLLRDRAANSTATSTVIIQHYPDLQFANHKDRIPRDVYKNALAAGRKNQLLSAYGHTHDQKCDGRTADGVCTDLLTGGGGGCCGPEVNLAGFTAVTLDDAGGFTVDVESSDVRMNNGQCKW